MNTTTTEAPVLFEERSAANGARIGIATLNAPKALNGLSLEMAQLLDAQLVAWAQDQGIVLVLLQGSGDKAFCAGGDLRGLYRSMAAFREAGETDIRANVYASAFFETEYRLDHRIHTYPKPLICWGHGIVMGGGIGLMAGASHRVVRACSKLAFPEITVGLYPDVGGSWLLNRVPDRGGLFLALTGAPLSAGDAIHAGLADHLIDEAPLSAVIAALCSTAWAGDATDHERIGAVLRGFSRPAEPGPLQRHAARIRNLCDGDDLDAVVAAIAVHETDDPWLQTAKATLAAGAPGSARLAFELQRRASALSLADTFRLEYTASLHCAAHGDFAEGIRALLIDKDRSPRWQPAALTDATAAWAAAFFAAPWPEREHPLADLGEHTRKEIHA